ncbi:MAG: hypothetical protein Q4F13_06805 [Pseudomonadota bacterium]|nr:hypothetical protein [Pseudomonadota bacterium]
MRLYILKVFCLGQHYIELRMERSACDAVLNAMARYPQACGISARRASA